MHLLTLGLSGTGDGGESGKCLDDKNVYWIVPTWYPCRKTWRKYIHSAKKCASEEAWSIVYCNWLMFFLCWVITAPSGVGFLFSLSWQKPRNSPLLLFDHATWREKAFFFSRCTFLWLLRPPSKETQREVACVCVEIRGFFALLCYHMGGKARGKELGVFLSSCKRSYWMPALFSQDCKNIHCVIFSSANSEMGTCI